jgi:Protein of unknown function (DUF1232)
MKQTQKPLIKSRAHTNKASLITSEPIMSHFEDLSVPIWKSAGKPMTIDEFIEDQRQYVNAFDLGVLRAFSSRLVGKLNGTNADHFPGLAESVHIIVQVLESPAARHATDPLPVWLAEMAFAAGYLLKGFDLIPDHFVEIGLADDAFILRRAIERNQADLQACLRECIEYAVGKKS